jgi:hypothetical protein
MIYWAVFATFGSLLLTPENGGERKSGRMRKGCLLRKLVWLRSVEGMLELGRERRIKEDGDS